jgi:site-specific DNA recombinase
MVKKLKDFKTLTGRKKAAKISPKLAAKRLELAQVESEIEKLLDTLTGASPVLLSYANSKIEELDARRQSIANEIAKLSADAVPMEKMESISGYLDDWENVSFEDKRQVVDALITVIRATNEKVEIEWKI